MSIAVAKAALRRVVLKAAAFEHQAWIEAGLPMGSGLDVRAMAMQMALLAEQVNAWLKNEQALYVAYVKAHPPTLLPIAKASLADLPPETALNYHAWLEDTILRRQTYDPGTGSFTETQQVFQSIMRQGLTEATGTGGATGGKAAGALPTGFSNLTQTQAKKLLKELAPLEDSNSLSARSMFAAVRRQAESGGNAAVLRDGAGRPIGAATWYTSGGHLGIDVMGALDDSSPGAGLQMIREIAGRASAKGQGIYVEPMAPQEQLFKDLGFKSTGYGYSLSAGDAAALAAKVPDSGAKWTQVGFMEGPNVKVRAGSPMDQDVYALRDEARKTPWISQGKMTAGSNGDVASRAIEGAAGARSYAEHMPAKYPPEDVAKDTIMVARDASGKIIGAAWGSPSKDALHINFIGTAPDAPVGVGRRMVRELAQRANESGQGLSLSSLPEAEAFYQRLGMTQTGVDKEGLKTYGFNKDQTASFASGLTGSGANFSGQISWELAVSGADEALRGTTIKRVVDQVSAETHQSIVNTLADGLSKGEGVDSLSLRVQQMGGSAFNEVRGQRIARTEVITANRKGQLGMAKDVGAQKKTWRAQVGSPRTRKWHAAANNQTVDIDKPFKIPNSKGMIQELMVPGDYSHGATGDNTINCFPGKTMVRAWGIERSYRRWYKGSMVTIHTALGDELSATPNHPVLSSRGWVAVGLLKEGDYLVRCSLGDGQPPDVEGAPATIGEIHEALRVASALQRVIGSGDDFHGDGRYGQVDVVTAAGQLGDVTDTPEQEHVSQLALAHADLRERGLAGYRPGAECGRGVVAPESGTLGRVGQAPSLLWSGLSHAEEHAFAATARFDASPKKDAPDDVSIAPEALGDSLLRHASAIELENLVRDVGVLPDTAKSLGLTVVPEAARALESRVDGHLVEAQALRDFGCSLPGLIELDRVVDVIRREDFSGHVYNLQTAGGWYLAGTLASFPSGNCRCVVRYEKKGVSDAKALTQPDQHGTVDPEVKPPVPVALVNKAAAAEPLPKVETPPSWQEQAQGLLGKGQISYADTHKLGGIIGDEIDARYAPAQAKMKPLEDDLAAQRKAYNDMVDERAKIRKKYARGTPELEAALEKSDQLVKPAFEKLTAAKEGLDAARAGAKSRSEMAQEMLSQLRPMGGDLKLQSPAGAGRQAKTLRNAAQTYPVSWTSGQPVRVLTSQPLGATVNRSCYDNNGGIYLKGAAKDDIAVARHELGHFVEDTVPGLHDKIVRHYEERTAGQPLQSMAALHPGEGYGPNEMTIPDKWWHDYAGESYVGANGERYATEQLSMAAQYLFGTPAEQAEIWGKDPESARFFLGLMAGA